MRRSWRGTNLSEIYMWSGAVFTIAVVIIAEMGRGMPGGAPSPWTSFFPQLTATLVGGAIAGFVAYGLNRRSRTDLEKDAAVRLIIKLKLIADDFHSVVATFEESLLRANEDRQTDLQMWQRIRPIIGLGDPYLVEAAEAAVFLANGEEDIANRSLLIAIRHRTFLSVVRKYNELRASTDDLATPSEVDGMVATYSIPFERRLEFDMKSNELEELVRGLISTARRDSEEAKILCDQVGPIARRIFGDKYLPILVPAETE